MSDLRSELLAADSSFERIGGEGEGFYCYGSGVNGGSTGGEEEFHTSVSSQHQTWSQFEDLDDSGHFTASPDGEKALSGSSRSHSPCLSSTSLLLQMQHQQQLPDSGISSNSLINSQQPFVVPSQRNQPQSLEPPSNQKDKPMISPRSVMTVKVPQNSSNAPSVVVPISPSGNTSHEKHPSNRPVTYTVKAYGNPKETGSPSAETSVSVISQLGPNNIGASIDFSNVFPSSSTPAGDGDASSGPLRSNGSPRDESCDYLRRILGNFNSLYIEKLRMIDNLVDEGNGNEDQRKLVMEKKTSILENWAKDVCIQNMVLVHTVEELEKEANRKVAALQKKMIESTQLAKEHMTMIKKYEEQVKLLLKNHSDSEEKNLVLNFELEKLKSECRRERDRMNWLLKDNDALLTLACRIRDMGVWDISGLEFQRSAFDQIFGLYPSLIGAEVQTVFTREKARHVKETEEKVIELKDELQSLKNSHREASSFLMQKDRKIEELEIEIKNLLNKAHYCEQECNEYKRSLVETQEQLLEATRRLAQSSKQVHQFIKANDLGAEGGGENELTELIKELRQVKSQLNAAIEEKQTAKDESTHFKKELGDRLKEMHDIQNVFQNLATEVVSSRSAFQQVQEMEVQLQSLKGEIQTYQSRCANAEDTILSKEKEIKDLQQQMNDIHKRRSTPTPVSTVSLHSIANSVRKSEKASSINVQQCKARTPVHNISPASVTKLAIKSSSNNIPSRIPVIKKGNNTKCEQQVSNYASIIAPTWEDSSNDKDSRPPWNIHFKKSTGILSRAPPALPPVPKLAKIMTPSSRSHSSLTRNSYTKTEIDFEKEPYEFVTDQSTMKSNNTTPVKRSSSGSAVKGQLSATNLFKLPKVQSKECVLKSTKEQLTNQVAVSAKSPLNMNWEKLPILHHDTKGTIPKATVETPTPRKLNKLLHKSVGYPSNPRGVTPRLNELITAVVETSKKLLEKDGADDAIVKHWKKRNEKHLSITASHHNHYRRHRKPKDYHPVEDCSPHYGKTNLRHTKSNERNLNSRDKINSTHSDSEDDAKSSLKLATKFHSLTEVRDQHHYQKNSNDEDGDSKGESVEVVFQPSADVKEYLSQLPEDSFEDVVLSWIKKSPSHTSTVEKKKQIHSKSMPVAGRQSSVRIMKHLATRRCPPKHPSRKSNQSSKSAENLANEMFELEHEWGKVFANLESSTNGRERTMASESVPRDRADVSEVVDKPCGHTTKEFNQTFEKDECNMITTSKCVNSKAEASPQRSSEEQSNGTKCQELESMKDLLERLTKEKQEMEDHYKKELLDKDIELKMQKVTIQHLQDAYVALKRGQPIPVPQNATGNKIVTNNATSANSHHQKINNNNNILDV